MSYWLNLSSLLIRCLWSTHYGRPWGYSPEPNTVLIQGCSHPGLGDRLICCSTLHSLFQWGQAQGSIAVRRRGSGTPCGISAEIGKNRGNSWSKQRAAGWLSIRVERKKWEMKQGEGPDDGSSFPPLPPHYWVAWTFSWLTGKILEGSKHGSDWIWPLPTPPSSSLSSLLPQ